MAFILKKKVSPFISSSAMLQKTIVNVLEKCCVDKAVDEGKEQKHGELPKNFTHLLDIVSRFGFCTGQQQHKPQKVSPFISSSLMFQKTIVNVLEDYVGVDR